MKKQTINQYYRVLDQATETQCLELKQWIQDRGVANASYQEHSFGLERSLSVNISDYPPYTDVITEFLDRFGDIVAIEPWPTERDQLDPARRG